MEAIRPSVPGLVAMGLPIALVVAILIWRRLGQVRALAIAIVRMVVQLMLLGLVLEWVFKVRNPGIVLGVAGAMLLAASQAVGARQGKTAPGVRVEALFSILCGVSLVMAVAIQLALNVEPWYRPEVVIPLLGMILGNSVNGVSLAADRLESDLRADRERVELRLALGASARQAAKPAIEAAVKSALTPAINGMMIAGLVAVPGMMAGQVLVGADVTTALRYQMLVYLAISGTSGLSTLILLRIRLRHYFTPADQLRLEPEDETPARS
jgi:putative ABC transport system permease protein